MCVYVCVWRGSWHVPLDCKKLLLQQLWRFRKQARLHPPTFMIVLQISSYIRSLQTFCTVAQRALMSPLCNHFCPHMYCYRWLHIAAVKASGSFLFVFFKCNFIFIFHTHFQHHIFSVIVLHTDTEGLTYWSPKVYRHEFAQLPASLWKRSIEWWGLL